MGQETVSERWILVVIVPARRLNRRRAAQMAGVVTGLMGSGVRMVLDLSLVGEMDGDGLEWVLETGRRVRDLGGEMKICGSRAQVRIFLELAEVHRRIDICNDLAEAVSGFD